MKKTIALLLALVMCLSLFACGGGKDAPETEVPTEIKQAPTTEATEPSTIETEESETTAETEALTETQNVESTDYWVIDNVVDDFGDSTGERVIKGLFTGTFSNTATSNSDLAVWVFYNPDEQVFYFRLLEYTDHQATYLDSDTITFKTKTIKNSTEEVDECPLVGTAPNGDLILTSSNQGNSFYTSATLLSSLYYGYDVKCVIEIGSSKYSFTIFADGFNTVFDEYKNS